MRKLLRLGIIVVIVAGVLYVGYLVFVNPRGFTNKETLVESFIDNINSSDVCEKHFNEETLSYCEDFVGLFEGNSVVITEIDTNGSNVVFSLMIDDNVNEIEFTASFVSEEVTGLKSFFNKEYLLIDYIIG